MAPACRIHLAEIERHHGAAGSLRGSEAAAGRLSKDASGRQRHGDAVSIAPPAPETRERSTVLQSFENFFSIAALSLMTALPVIEMIARQFQWPGIPGSAVVVQQLTLWIGMLGGMLASRSDRLLGLSSSTFLPESWRGPAKIISGAVLAAVSTCLAWASYVFVQSERESGSGLLPGVPKWTAVSIMLIGFTVIALRA